MEKGNRHHYRPRRSSVEYEEEQVWIKFYRSAGEVDSALELIDYLGSDPDLKRKHSALYLRCKQTVRRARERQAKAKRIGHFIRMGLRVLVVTPFLALRSALRLGGNIAMECLPETAAEPASRRVKKLAKNPRFVQDDLDFAKSGTEGAVQQGKEAGKDESSRSKAA